jgi:SNF2 family DNA or RNA helicase
LRPRHRIGQTRPVTIYRLVTADTIEEKIVQPHQAKRDLLPHFASSATIKEIAALGGASLAMT